MLEYIDVTGYRRLEDRVPRMFVLPKSTQANFAALVIVMTEKCEPPGLSFARGHDVNVPGLPIALRGDHGEGNRAPDCAVGFVQKNEELKEISTAYELSRRRFDASLQKALD